MRLSALYRYAKNLKAYLISPILLPKPTSADATTASSGGLIKAMEISARVSKAIRS